MPTQFDEGKHSRDAKGKFSNTAAMGALNDAAIHAEGLPEAIRKDMTTRIVKLQALAKDEYSTKMPLERNAIVRMLWSAQEFLQKSQGKELIKGAKANVHRILSDAINAFPSVDRGLHK